MHGIWLGSVVLGSVVSLLGCFGTHFEVDTGSDTDPTSTNPGEGALDLPAEPYNYAGIELPAHYVASVARGMDNTPAGNPVTDDGATLGRVLFYDTALSLDSQVACASCHVQKNAFADSKPLSVGFGGELTARNAMSLSEARYYRNGRFFWDERAATLEDQVLLPIQNGVEMGLTLEELVSRVRGQEYYASLFEKAFGDQVVTTERISLALAQFVRSIVSVRSRFDHGMAATGDIEEPFAGFTTAENHGKTLFLGKAGCASCHLDNGPAPEGTPPGEPAPRVNQGIFFLDFAANNGLPLEGGDGDGGVGDISGNPADAHRFKSSSLRNVALTGPYMHDGRFASLEEVVEHYDSGVEASPNLDSRLLVPGSSTPRKLKLTSTEKAALVAFLGTLTDEALLVDPRYSSPFVSLTP